MNSKFKIITAFFILTLLAGSVPAAPVNVSLVPNQLHTHHTPYAGLGFSDDHIIGFTSGSAIFYEKEDFTPFTGYGNIGTVIDGGAGRIPNQQRLELDNSGRVRNVRNANNFVLNNLSLSAYKPLAVSSVFYMTHFVPFLRRPVGIYFFNQRCSISSRLLPFVSGTHFQTNRTKTAPIAP